MHTGPGRTLRQEAPCKVNLGLHVLRKRDDGFHDIETVFLRIPWHDAVSVRYARELSMSCSDSALPVDDVNTCMRAARLLADHCALDIGAHIHLDKRVPYGAGLGSGSSDAAATLRLLDELWGLNLGTDELMEVGSCAGSDVCFFLNGRLAYAEGRGEKLTPLDCDATAIPDWMVVVVPQIHVSSGEAYGLVTPRETGRVDLRGIVSSGDMAQWSASLVNDFEGPILARYPETRRARTHLLESGAVYASLSGSGSAVFGMFDSEESARIAASSGASVHGSVWWGPVRD